MSIEYRQVDRNVEMCPVKKSNKLLEQLQYKRRKTSHCKTINGIIIILWGKVKNTFTWPLFSFLFHLEINLFKTFFSLLIKQIFIFVFNKITLTLISSGQIFTKNTFNLFYTFTHLRKLSLTQIIKLFLIYMIAVNTYKF